MLASQCKILENIAVLSTDESGWTKEINLVAWADKTVIDVRVWSPDHLLCDDGFTMTRKEFDALLEKSEEWHRKEKELFALPEIPQLPEEPKQAPETLWYCHHKSSGAMGIGYPVERKFLVCKGSTIPHTVGANYDRSNELRCKLIEDGVIVDFTFVQDYVFNSCSAAAGIIQARSSNGWIEWMTEDGVLLNTIRKNKKAQ